MDDQLRVPHHGASVSWLCCFVLFKSFPNQKAALLTGVLEPPQMVQNAVVSLQATEGSVLAPC